MIEQERDGDVVVAAADGDLPDGLLGQRVSLSESVAAVAQRELRTVRLGDDETLTRFERHDGL